MAIQNILPDLTHIARTTYQWEHTADKYEIIPNGVLCIEFVKVDQTLIKIGDGHHIYKQLPYVSSIDLKNYYTKEETDNRIIEIFNELKSIRIKGEVSDLSNLPTDNNTEGDLWFVRRTSPTGHSRYDEYVWYKNNWESIGLSESDIDLSEYAKKEYVDEKIEEVDEKIDRYMHTHSNKEILDQITAPFTTEKDEKLESLHNYDDTEIRRIIDERTHTHSNKSILDQTSAAYTTDKDNKLASLENYDDTAVQDRLEILERIAHFHENQEILNRTTAAFTREQAITLLDCKDFEGTDGTNDGYHGFVPAPTASDAGKVLGANGQWVPMSGGGGGDTVAEGGGISITTDAQTGNKVISVNAGTGLSIDPVTGELNVTGGGGGGDTVAEGGGISITTDPQTGVKTISVNTGDNLEVDPDTGELNITGVDYTAGQGIFIGNEYQNVEYIKNSGNYDQIILTDIIPAFSDKIELDIKFGAPSVATVWDRPIMGCNGTTPSTFLYTVTLYLASNDSNLGCYNHFKYETGNTGRNFFIRPSGISYDGSSSVRKTLTMKGSTATWGTDSKEFSSEYNSSFIDPQIGIAVFGRAGQSSNTIFNSCELTVYGVKLYDSNDTLLHNLVPVKKLSNNEGGLYDTVTNKFYGNSGNGSFVTGPAVETDDRIINAKIGSGLGFDSNNAIEVLTGAGLSINQDNELEVLTGNGLQINQDGEVEIDPSIIPEAAEYSSGEAITIRDVSQILPAGYVEVDYIEGIGNYTVINYIPNRKTKIVGTASQTQTSYDPVLFGNRTGSNGQQFVFWFNRYDSTQAKVGFVYGTNTWSTSSDCDNGKLIPYTLEDQFTFLISLDDEFNINDSFVHNITENGAPASNLKLGIFALVNSSSDEIESSDQIFRGRMYEFKIYEDDELVVNLIPAVSTSTNQSGFYDVINDIFYTSKTATPFGYDPSTIHSTGKVIDVNYGNGLTVNQNNELEVNTGDGLFIDSTNNDVNVKIGQALSINNSNEIDVNLGRALSINNNNEIDVDIATATSLGVVKAGSGLNIDEFGNLSTQATPFRIGRALSLDDESVRLPSAYAKAKYVANTSNAAVRIGFRPSDYPNAKYVSSVSLDSCGSSYSYPTRYLCGASGWVGSMQIPLDGVSGGLPIKTFFFIGNGNRPEYISTAFQFGDRFDIEASVLGGYKINNEVVQASATPPSNFGTYNLAIFGSGASNGPGEPGFIGKMYYFRIYNSDDTLLCNLVPAVRRTDDVVGFYDMVGNQFYPSETNTAFTTDMDDLDVDEPDWVLNASIATSNSLGVVKPGTGLLVNEHGALTLDKASASTIGGVKVGNNLSIDSDGVLSANIINYSAGHAIEIIGDLSIDKFRWEITANAGDSMVAFRYFEYSDSDHIAFTVQAGTIEWSDGSTVSYPSGYDETFAGMMENRTKCTVTGWTGDKTLIMTFRLAQSIMLSDIAYFRWQTDDYMSGRQPQEFNIYAHDSINDEWILLKSVTDHSLVPISSNTWSTYIDIEPEIEPGSINVKYGNGLTVNQNNELEVATASASTLGGIKVGSGLSITADGTLSATGGGGGDTVAEGGGISITTDAQTGDKVISVNAGSGLEIDPVTGELNVIGGGSGGGGNYSAGEAIELDDSQLSFNVDAIRWDVSDIKNTSQGGGSTWMQIRYIEFCNAAGTAYTIDSGSGIWEDNTAVEYSHDPAGGGSQEISDMIANVRKMCATWRYPDHTMKLTFMLHTVVPVANIAKFRIKLGDDVPERDPKEWRMYVRNASDQSWHLVQYVQDAGLSNQRNVWSDYFEFNLDEPIIINVKYGDGLSIDENGALSTTQYVAGDGIEINPYEGLVVENTEYYFDTQVSCEIHGSFNRTFQKTTADPALGVIWKCYDGGNLWGGPLFVGLTADAVKYTTEGTTYNAKGTFNYLGRTWYYSDTSYYVQNPQDQDYLGNLQVFTDAYDYVTDEVDAAKRLIDAAHVYNNLDEISVKIGQRLKIESDGSVNAKGYLEGEGISIDTSDYLLPTGYTRIKALSSTLNGNQYINTGYKLKPDTTIDMKCTLYKRGTSVWAIPLGGRVYNSYAVGGMLFVTTNSDNLVPSTGVDTPSLWIESSLNYPPSGQINLWYNDIIDLHFDNQSVTCENQRTHEQSVITSQTAISATSSYDLYVFATNNGNNAAFFGVMDLYELTISENNIIIHRYIPCKRDSDDKYGLYDIIDNEFKLSPNNNLFSYVPGLPIDDINETISLLPATTTTLGGVKIGEGLSVDSEGYVSSKLYEAGQGITFDEAASEGQFKVRNLEYYFDNQVSLQIDGSYGPRTFTRVSQYEQCLIAIVQTTFSGQMWTTPACIGLTETSCKYSNSYDSYIIGPDATFDYKGYTWYIGMNYGLMNSTGVDLLGNVQGPIDLTSIDTGGGQNLDLVGKAIIDLAGLVVYEESIDVWNSGTGWLNGAYNDSQSDQFWTNWYYTYHSKQDEYLEVPAGAIKMRLIGISNENDSRLQGGGVDCFNSSHHHFTTVGCMTDEWADIPDGTVYLQFGVKWNELNDRTISSSDIKSVNIEFYYDTPRNDVINAKLGNGLEFDSNDAIRVKLGDGLGFDANGALEVTGGGGGDSIDEGAGIEITTDPLTDVKTISINYGTGLTVDPITNALMVDGQLPEGTIIKKMTFMGNGNGTSHTISFEKKPLAILSIYGSSGTNYIAAIPAPIDAPYLQGNYGGVSTNGQSCSCAISYNDATNELTFTQAYYGGSDSGLIYNANNVTYTVYYLIKGHTGSGTSATNEVSVIKTFSYVGTGTATNNIQFPETPDYILNISGPLGSIGDIITDPMDIQHPTTTSTYIFHWTQFGSALTGRGFYSFNDSTNVLTLDAADYGGSLNYTDNVYYVRYIVNEVISTTMPYDAGEAISIETIGGLQPTNYSNDDFVDSIMSMNAGTIVKAADKSSFTLTASSDDCYTRGASGEANGSYPFNVKASTKYRFAWDSADPTVHGKVYTYENGLYDAMMHEIDQYDSSYLEFTTSANTTFIQARFGVMYAGNSITYSNVRLYEVIEDEDQYNEISVKYGDGLTVNERNELEVKYGNGLEIVSNTQYRPEYYFNTQVQCQVHTDSYYSTSASFDRTYQKTTTEPALCCIWEVGDSGALWTGPLLVGTTATSVQYTTQDTSQTVNYQNTFTYLGQTWYTSGYPDFLNAADHEDKLNHLQYLGSYTAVSDQIQAATDLINLALINAGSLQAKLGNGLSFDANGAIQVTGGGGGGGDTVAQGNGISITTDAQTGNKVIAVNAGTGLAFDQTTHALEVSSGVVTSIAPTQNTPGAITITEGDGTTSSVQVLSAMGGATSSTAGTAGYVPAPASGDDDAYLRGDGTWDDDVVTENDLLTLVFVPDDYTPPTP